MKEEKKKPRGTMGHVVIHPHRQIAEFIPVEFPHTKAEIESYIIEHMLIHAKRDGLNPYKLKRDPIQNPENNFDFTLTTELGEQYLDLMEIAPLEQISGSYEKAPSQYNNGELADFIYSKIISKSKKYGPSPKSVIHLLLYRTDWKFYTAEGVLNLLAYYCHRAEHCFSSILYFSPAEKNDGNMGLIYPREGETFHEFDEARLRRRCTAILDINDIRESIVFGSTSEDS